MDDYHNSRTTGAQDQPRVPEVVQGGILDPSIDAPAIVAERQSERLLEMSPEQPSKQIVLVHAVTALRHEQQAANAERVIANVAKRSSGVGTSDASSVAIALVRSRPGRWRMGSSKRACGTLGSWQ